VNPQINATGSFIGTVVGYQYGDVVLANVNVLGGEIMTSIEKKGIRVGGLVGFSVLADGAKLTLDDCDVSGTVIAGYHNVGGLVGTLYNYLDHGDKWSICNCDVEDITIIFGSGNQNHVSPFAVDGAAFPDYDTNKQTFTDIAKGNTEANVVITAPQG